MGGTSFSLRRPVTVGLLMAALAGPTAAVAQSEPSAEELYDEYFGCWTCHGPRGQGGDGQPLRGTYLPLSFFIKALRLPAGEMPPFSEVLATDRELAVVYAWLEGVDRVAQPTPLELTLHEAGDAGDDGLELTLATRRLGAGDDAPAFTYRATLVRRDESLVADQRIELWTPGQGERTSLVTDRYGQVRWGAAPPGSPAVPSGEEVRLGFALPAGEYALVVEAVGTDNPEDPAILGIGSTVVRVE